MKVLLATCFHDGPFGQWHACVRSPFILPD